MFTHFNPDAIRFGGRGGLLLTAPAPGRPADSIHY
ncbi:hypothetical protein Enr8_14410 [Blastopirellula retiformator]|uniref:Uncharacterized protein n=1 Tax=Blastopirellula retiformator TaxID=2527970 RepID=A0A5C5VPW5_9BACT|nr:hypothetical protein Enr8_14410 [Blastopirellula retiformator]